MKTEIEVADRKEAQLIKSGLDDPATRALVKVIGALKPHSKRAQERILGFVFDHLEEQASAAGRV